MSFPCTNSFSSTFPYPLADQSQLLSRPQWIVKCFMDNGINQLGQDIDKGLDALARGKDALMPHLDMVAKAEHMSAIYAKESSEEIWIQVCRCLQWHAIRCEKTEKFVEEMEEYVQGSWTKTSIGFLQSERDAAANTASNRGRVLDIRLIENVFLHLWEDLDLGAVRETHYKVIVVMSWRGSEALREIKW